MANFVYNEQVQMTKVYMSPKELLEMHEVYSTMVKGLAGKKELLRDANADFEERMEANAAFGRANEYRIHFFPFVREHVFGMPNELSAGLKARYVALDDARVAVQVYIREMVYQDPTKAMEATTRMGDNIQTEREIVEDAIAIIKQNMKK